MQYITLLAVIGILLLQWTGSIPLASVGGSMMIALAFFAAALSVGVHEAWTKKRGVFGMSTDMASSVVVGNASISLSTWYGRLPFAALNGA